MELEKKIWTVSMSTAENECWQGLNTTVKYDIKLSFEYGLFIFEGSTQYLHTF